MADIWAIFGSRNFFVKCLTIKLQDSLSWMGVCSFTSLRYFQWFINLQRRIQIEKPLPVKEQPASSAMKVSFFQLPCLHEVATLNMHKCWLWDWGLLPVSSPLCKAELSAPRAGLMALMCLRLQMCQHILTCVYPSLPENRGGSGLQDPGSCIHRGYLWNILLLVQHVWRMKMKEFWYIQMVYICYYRHVHSRIVQEKQHSLQTTSFCRCGVSHNTSAALAWAGSPSRASWDASLVSESPRI